LTHSLKYGVTAERRWSGKWSLPVRAVEVLARRDVSPRPDGESPSQRGGFAHRAADETVGRKRPYEDQARYREERGGNHVSPAGPLFFVAGRTAAEVMRVVAIGLRAPLERRAQSPD